MIPKALWDCIWEFHLCAQESDRPLDLQRFDLVRESDQEFNSSAIYYAQETFVLYRTGTGGVSQTISRVSSL